MHDILGNVDKLKRELYAEYNRELIGLHTHISNDEYHAGPGLSKSSLDKVAQSINHWLANERKETPAMLKGTCVHAALLEPESWKKDFVRAPDIDKRSNEYLKVKRDVIAQGKVLVPYDLYMEVEDIVIGCLSNKVAQDLLCASGMERLPEASVYAEDPDTGLLIRCRPDLLLPGIDLIVDLKTTKCAATTGSNHFGRSAGMFNYDKQEAIYTDIMDMTFPGASHEFVFIAVENAPPYNCTVFEMDAEDVAYGRMRYKEDLQKLHYYLQNPEEVTSGYSGMIEKLKIPGYFRR